MSCFSAKARALAGSRAATATTVASGTWRAGRTSAIGAMRAAPRMPTRSVPSMRVAYPSGSTGHPLVDEVNSARRLGAAVVGGGAGLQRAVRSGHPAVLPQVLDPRLDHERLEIAARPGGVGPEPPADRSVAQPHLAERAHRAR